MLHRVLPIDEGSFSPNRDMAISPEFLETFIMDARKRGYTFVSLNRMFDELRGGKAEKLLAITLDDGYSDNYMHAYPIFKKYDVPFTVYVTTSFPDGDAILWWYKLENYLKTNNEIRCLDGTTMPCCSVAEKLTCFTQLRQKIMASTGKDFHNSLQHIWGGLSVSWKDICSQEAMSWQQIKELSQDSLACIGAHTVNHLRLSSLSDSDVFAEVSDSCKRIAEHTGKAPAHFCYPFGARGDADQREFDLIRKMGFKTATTTRWGNIFPGHYNNPEALPRVPLTNRFTWGKFRVQSLKRFLKGRKVTL